MSITKEELEKVKEFRAEMTKVTGFYMNGTVSNDFSLEPMEEIEDLLDFDDPTVLSVYWSDMGNTPELHMSVSDVLRAEFDESMINFGEKTLVPLVGYKENIGK